MAGFINLLLLFCILCLYFKHAFALSQGIHDYYEGDKYFSPDYTPAFSQHIDAIEIEYLEYFTQLAPVKVPPIVLSPCLSKNQTEEKRGFVTTLAHFKEFARQLPGLLNHEINKALGRPPMKPKYAGYCVPTSLTINLYYHVVASSQENFNIAKPEWVAAQTKYMNDMYAHLNIQFIQRDLNYRINPDFARSPESHTHPHRRETRSGNYWDLNVWLVENIPNDPGANDGTSIDGYSDFPNATSNAYQRTFDGVVIAARTITGAPTVIPGSTSVTLPHEVGHWLGLFHVFSNDRDDAGQGLQCSLDDTDKVIDTEQYTNNQNFQFEATQMPCGSTKLETITNIMSYSLAMGTDGIGFTTGQKARIYSHYLGIRRGLKNLAGCPTAPVAKRDLPDNVIEMLREDDQNCLATFHASINPDPSLQPPPDPQYPFYPVIAVPQREPIPWMNPNDPPTAGSADPLGGYTEFEDGGVDGKAVTHNEDQNGNPTPNNPTPPSNQTCPASCNIHQNSCDKPSAQTCIYPDPFAMNPRAASYGLGCGGSAVYDEVQCLTWGLWGGRNPTEVVRWVKDVINATGVKDGNTTVLVS
ncbi:hypothetical protein AOQ84DRAFT_388796 [Glonium stellatum]|uniref:Peptidase M43 pregnancy-associated plasma-A domain-containing protein n=1 Tax=Glonium stellatum TaxID=574774 RepID=A0A8E2F1P9_9PEZI|nr:hypothetical protein AOQ84DRAFT_388796 [Glonium stellatum]